jgi:hypothetical protein
MRAGSTGQMVCTAIFANYLVVTISRVNVHFRTQVPDNPDYEKIYALYSQYHLAEPFRPLFIDIYLFDIDVHWDKSMRGEWLGLELGIEWLGLELGIEWLGLELGIEWLGLELGIEWLGLELGIEWRILELGVEWLGVGWLGLELGIKWLSLGYADFHRI